MILTFGLAIKLEPFYGDDAKDDVSRKKEHQSQSRNGEHTDKATSRADSGHHGGEVAINAVSEQEAEMGKEMEQANNNNNTEIGTEPATMETIVATKNGTIWKMGKKSITGAGTTAATSEDGCITPMLLPAAPVTAPLPVEVALWRHIQHAIHSQTLERRRICTGYVSQVHSQI